MGFLSTSAGAPLRLFGLFGMCLGLVACLVEGPGVLCHRPSCVDGTVCSNKLNASTASSQLQRTQVEHAGTFKADVPG